MNHNSFLKIFDLSPSIFKKLLLILSLCGMLFTQQADARDPGSVNYTAPDDSTAESNAAGAAENVRIGAGGSFGYYTANHTYGDGPEWEAGYGYGGGFVFERMLTGVFGIHSGIWYSRFKMKMEFSGDSTDGDDPSGEYELESESFTLPFYLISSLDSKYITFNLLTGFNFTYISKSYMKQESGTGMESEDIKKFIASGQLGAGGGIEFLFRLTRFTKLFVAVLGEYYFTDLIKEADDTSDFIYDFKINSGFMVCTF